MVKVKVFEVDTNGDRSYTGSYPHVTELTDLAKGRFIYNWRKRVGDEEADRVRDVAKQIGTAVHTIAEAIGKTHGTDETVEVPAEFVPYALATRKFFDTWIEEVIATEQAFKSHVHGFGGKTDLIARIKEDHGGGIAIVDFKTTKALTRDDGLQVAAYRRLAIENGYDIDRRILVRIKKEPQALGKYAVREYPDHDVDEEGFLAILRFYYWMKNQLPPLAEDMV